jgi:hypothetical protein
MYPTRRTSDRGPFCGLILLVRHCGDNQRRRNRAAPAGTEKRSELFLKKDLFPVRSLFRSAAVAAKRWHHVFSHASGGKAYSRFGVVVAVFSSSSPRNSCDRTLHVRATRTSREASAPGNWDAVFSAPRSRAAATPIARRFSIRRSDSHVAATRLRGELDSPFRGFTPTAKLCRRFAARC